MTPTGRWRQSTSSSVVRSMVKILGPTNFRKRVEMPLPLLCPGVWKETLRLSARLTIASKRGVLRWRSASAAPIAPLSECEQRMVVLDNLLFHGQALSYMFRKRAAHGVRFTIIVPQFTVHLGPNGTVN